MEKRSDYSCIILNVIEKLYSYESFSGEGEVMRGATQMVYHQFRVRCAFLKEWTASGLSIKRVEL